MDIKTIHKIAKRYGFKIAANEEEVKKYEKLGYHKVNLDLKEVMPELFDDHCWVRAETEVVETESGDEWIARFPDVGNVGGGGDTEEEAIKDAAINLHYELMFLKDEMK